jgi:hypothetical protein
MLKFDRDFFSSCTNFDYANYFSANGFLPSIFVIPASIRDIPHIIFIGIAGKVTEMLGIIDLAKLIQITELGDYSFREFNGVQSAIISAQITFLLLVLFENCDEHSFLDIQFQIKFIPERCFRDFQIKGISLHRFTTCSELEVHLFYY